MSEIGQDVYVVEDAVPHLTRDDIDRFKAPVRQTARMRRRLCTHRNVVDRLHEMFVTYVKETYVHPNKHIGKDESLHILEGRADFVFFDEDGEIREVVPLGAYGSDVAFYCRIPKGIYHTWIIHSDVIVVHETTPGPFDRQDTIFAPWAPGESDPEAPAYMDELATRAATFQTNRLQSATESPGTLEMNRQSSEVYVANSPIVSVAQPDMQFLIAGAPASPRGRIRLCAHAETGDRLQEMFIALGSTTYLRPSFHTKDESLHVLHGTGSYVFFDETGHVTDVIPLGDYGFGRQFYCRIPRSAYHALVVESDVILIHEITSGPFNRSDTIFAPWAPDDSSPDAPGYREWLKSVAAHPPSRSR